MMGEMGCCIWGGSEGVGGDYFGREFEENGWAEEVMVGGLKLGEDWWTEEVMVRGAVGEVGKRSR